MYDLTFSVQKGEILGFLGPNGAGKTTTMRILTGYMPPTSGTARVAGFDIFEQPAEAKRRIGYLPEIPPLYPEMTVKAQLSFVADLKGVPRASRKAAIARVVEATNLGPVYNRLVKNLSRGYKQRVGLAQALLGDPEVLILDEPTVGLDPKQIIEIRQLIRSLGGKHTVILSSHILPEVSMVCERVAIINHGRLVGMDTPEGLARKLSHSQQLLVAIKGPQAQVEAQIASLPGMASWRPAEGEGAAQGATGAAGAGSRPAQTGPVLRYHLEAQPDVDLREPLFFQMARAGYPILEMRQVSLSLEDVFLQLTTEENTEPGDGQEGPKEGAQHV
ncbi:MAG: ABC transporter ATP-binding protein [Firmicutes bacterium]|nr:ABC transporter ATP-binding protein [Bacillota bacterium]